LADARLQLDCWRIARHYDSVAEDRSYGSRVASQFIGYDAQWFSTLSAQESSKELFRGALIPMRLDQNVDHVAFLIHGSPEILLLAIDSNENLIQIPVVAQLSLSSPSIYWHSQHRTADTIIESSHTTR
jgi:hypothetical protein